MNKELYIKFIINDNDNHQLATTEEVDFTDRLEDWYDSLDEETQSQVDAMSSTELSYNAELTDYIQEEVLDEADFQCSHYNDEHPDETEGALSNTNWEFIFKDKK